METMCFWIFMLFFLVQYPTGFSLINDANNHAVYLEEERQLLLQLKQLSPVFPERYYRTKYWKGSSDCCLWDGVTCDYSTAHVIALDLRCNCHIMTSSGGVPSAISNLRHLTRLDVSNNHLEGQLPDAFSALQNLTHLDLNYNSLQGRIPSSLTNMSQLENLDISSNALTGPFPSTPGHGLEHLLQMDFSNNSIRGTIPPWLFTLPSLERLDLSSNKLTGRIGKLNSQTLEKLDLSSNGLNIELQSFYNLTRMKILRISNNLVTEHYSDIVNVSFPNLVQLKMSSCEIELNRLRNGRTKTA